MAVTRDCIEFDGDESAPPPEFSRIVWPRLKSRAGDVRAVILVDTRDLSSKKTELGAKSIPVPGVVELGPLAELDAKTEALVCAVSYYGGHLNAYYATDSDGLVSEFGAMWPCRRLMKTIQTGLSVADEVRISAAIEHALERFSFALTFFHDGAPALLFGHVDRLARILAERQGRDDRRSTERRESSSRVHSRWEARVLAPSAAPRPDRSTAAPEASTS